MPCELVETLDIGRHIRVLNCLSDPQTPQDVIDKTDVSRATVYRYINRYAETGLIEPVGKVGEDPRHAATLYVRTTDELTIPLEGRAESPFMARRTGVAGYSDPARVSKG